MYFPKSQIKENLHTNGGEFEIASTQEEYKGPYFETSQGKFYTGKNYNDKPNNLLIKTTLKSTPLESSKSEPLPKNYYLIDDSYYSAKNITSRGQAPRNPIQTINQPTDKDIQNGFFNRYFVKKGNEFKFIEISKEEFEKFKNKDSLVRWQLYIPIKIKWSIQGNREQVYNGNKTVVSLTEQRENLPGFTLFFRDQFDKFWLGK